MEAGCDDRALLATGSEWNVSCHIACLKWTHSCEDWMVQVNVTACQENGKRSSAKTDMINIPRERCWLHGPYLQATSRRPQWPCNCWRPLAIKVLNVMLVHWIITAHGSGLRRPCFARNKRRVEGVLSYRMFARNPLMWGIIGAREWNYMSREWKIVRFQAEE